LPYLKDDDETFPEDYEVQISRLVAQASTQLLQQNQAQAAQQQAQQMQQDPIIQMQQEELAIKRQDLQRKVMKDKSDIILKNKFLSFGWDAIIIDGHNFAELFKELSKCNSNKKPKVIIANTIKGKGVSFMENKLEWHHKAPTQDQFDIAIKDYE
jgi:transketolase